MSPSAPPSLPKYLAEGLPKQDDEVLREVREYINELLVAREQRRDEPVTEDELPKSAALFENESSNAVYLEYRTCDDENYSCMRGGKNMVRISIGHTMTVIPSAASIWKKATDLDQE